MASSTGAQQPGDKPAPASADLAGMRRPYLDRSHILDIDCLETRDPYKLWQRWFDEGAAKIRELGTPNEPNQMALATATKDGVPSVRYVLMKKHDETGFYFFTNYESRKAKELAENPRASLCMYWSELNRAVRIEGRVEKAPDAVNDEYFQSRPVASQIGAVVSPQSRPVESRESLDNLRKELEAKVAAGAPVERPSHWGGYRIAPDAYEFWQGQRDRLHDRIRFRRPEQRDNEESGMSVAAEGGWVCERLGP